MSADRNLLFGILALQLDFIARDQLVSAMHAWVLDKQRALGELLVEQGAMDGAARALLDALVEKHLALHDHDPCKSLQAVSSIGSVRDDLKKLPDEELQASLSIVSAAAEVDHRRTLPSTEDETRQAGSRFRILRPHARGGLGEVHVARDLELQREVALKEIQARHADSPESRARFLLEAEITGGLEHPGIVPVYGLGTYADGRPFYAMRFIRGDSLKEAIARFYSQHGEAAADRMRGERAVEFRNLLGRFVDICQAVAYAHSRGVLHRDLKPGNIMLGRFGETLVVDWGLAKALGTAAEPEAGATAEPPLRPSSSGSAETMAGSAIGTPAYMSPEQAEGRLDLLGPTSDVYSLGATLYHLLTGQSPHPEKDVHLVLAKVRRGEVTRPRHINSAVPPGLEAVCLKAMALRSEDRYSSPGDLGEDVERWLADEPVSAWPEPFSVMARRWAGRHRTLMASSAAALAVLVIALAGANWLLSRTNTELERAADETRKANQKAIRANNDLKESEKEARQLAEKEATARGEADLQRKLKEKQLQLSEALRYNSTIREAGLHWRNRDIAALRTVLEQCDPKRRGPEFHYLKRQSEQTVRPLWTNESIVTCMILSADGKRLYFGSQDSTVRAWDLEADREVFRLKTQEKGISSLALTTDETRLLCGSFDKTIQIWDVKEGKAAREALANNSQPTCLVLSADNKTLYSADGKGAIKVWDLEGGKLLHVMGMPRRYIDAMALDGKRLFVSSDTGEIKVVAIDQRKVVQTLKGHSGRVHDLVLTPSGKRLFSGGEDRSVRVWDTETGKQVVLLPARGADVTALALSSDGKRLFAANADGHIQIWDTGREHLTLRGHAKLVTSVAVSPDGHRLYSSSYDGTIQIWNLDAVETEGKVLTTLPRYAHLEASRDGKRLFLAVKNQIQEWDLGAETKPRPCLGSHKTDIFALALSKNGKRLASMDATSIKVWDLESGKPTHTFPMKGVCDVALSAEGDKLFAASAFFFPAGPKLFGPGEIKVWNLADGKAVTLREKGAQALAVSADGNRLYCAGPDGVISVFDREQDRETLTLHGHTAAVVGLVLSADERRLYSCSHDRTIRIWDLEVGREALPLSGHGDRVTDITLSSDGSRLYSSSVDRTIREWDLSAP